MQHYRLLRNNRESGPYTQQDLINLGLKAYDLVWLEGGSSAWKYPSEIEGLKSYAPPATDDLYVQFHNPQSRRPANTISSNTNSTFSSRKNSSSRYVSVILPAEIQPRHSTLSSMIPAEFTPAEPAPQPKEIIAPSRPVTIQKEEYSRENFQVDNRIAFTNSIPEKTKNRFLVAGALLVLLATGIYFGTSSKSLPDAADKQLPAVENSLVSLASTPVQNEAEISSPETPTLKPNKVLEFAAIKRHVLVTPSEYKVGYFGGISELVLSIKNNGDQKLSNIVIAVDYLSSDKSIHHTENIGIPAIDPKKSWTIAVPSSNDGVAIKTRVIGVNNLSAQ